MAFTVRDNKLDADIESIIKHIQKTVGIKVGKQDALRWLIENKFKKGEL